MDMENLFPILILAIWLFSSFSRKKGKKKEAAEGKKPPGKLKASLQDFFQQIRMEIEKAQAGEQHAPGSEAALHEQTEDDDLWIEPEAPPPPPVIERQKRPRRIRPAVGRVATGTRRRPDRQSATVAPAGDLRPEDLEAAMVWHEILSPPVAFRPDRE